MSRSELVSVISLGFLVFTILFIRVGFFFGLTISPLTLSMSFLWYVTSLYVLFLVSRSSNTILRNEFLAMGMFIVMGVGLYVVSFPMGNTYDLSWDGQGYHQSAIIALKEGWNPVSEASIKFREKLPSQIFAESYPSALWEVQSAVYAVTDQVNSGKILNFAIAGVAFFFVFALLRRLSMGFLFAGVIASAMVLQPVFLIQALTYMQDGFGYELLLIALSSLKVLIVTGKLH